MPSQDFWNSVNDAVKPKDPCGNDCRAEVSESLRQLQSIINGLKRHIGFHTPVLRLPPELLKEVFIFSAQPPRLDGSYHHYDKWAPTFIRTLESIIQVCGTWRKTALSNPLLWTDIPIRHRHYASLFLKRSKGLDITLWGPVHDSSQTANVVNYQEHMHRVQSLSIMFPPCNLMAPLPFQTAAPKLQTMELFSIDSHIFPTATAPHWDMPVLKSLSLMWLRPSWAWVGSLITLTSLSVVRSPKLGLILTSILDVLGALRNLQNLSFLQLHHACRAFDQDPVPPVEPSTLPKLQRVLLSGSHLVLHQFLVNMHLPSDVYLHIDASTTLDTERAEDIHRLATTIAQNYRIRIADGSIRKGPCCGLALHFGKGHVTLHAVQDGQDIYDSPPFHDRRASLHPSSSAGDPYGFTVRMKPTFSTGFFEFSNTLIEQGILSPDTFIIMGIPSISVKTRLLQWISRQPLVRILFMSTFSWFFDEFVDHDIGTAGLGDPGDEGRLRLPFLRQLQISDFNLRNEPDIISQLVAGVAHRQRQATAAGGSISVELSPMVIHIRDCEIERDQVQALRTGLQENATVEWDGKTKQPCLCL